MNPDAPAITSRQRECLRDAMGYLSTAIDFLQEATSEDSLRDTVFDETGLAMAECLFKIQKASVDYDLMNPDVLLNRYELAGAQLIRNLQGGTVGNVRDMPYGSPERQSFMEAHSRVLAEFIAVAAQFLKEAK